MSKRKWILIGVLASVLWAAFAGISYYREMQSRAAGFGQLSYRVCMSEPEAADASVAKGCEERRATEESHWIEMDGGYAKNVVFAALLPIPFIWIGGYTLLMLGRIQLAGFRSVVPWSTMGRVRKALTVGWLGVFAAAVMFAAMSYMTAITELRVPVGLGSPLMVIATGVNHDNLMVTGTWTRHGIDKKSEMGYPLQVSRIICNRPQGICTEAIAEVADATLLAPQLIEHEITSWANGVVTYTDESLCGTETYSINIETKSVSGIGRAAHDDIQFCKAHPPTEREWAYTMETGFDVYWKLRQASRPAALRFLQSLFGN